MSEQNGLERFLEAQATNYTAALEEIEAGRKQSHWMWYVFPQLKGLGRSRMAEFYGLTGSAEAADYLAHPILGTRLIEISIAILQHKNQSAHQIFGSPDDMKLKSCMTLFASLPQTNPVFQQVLDQFYAGQKDQQTLNLLALGR